MTTFQITTNEIISGVCSAIHAEYSDTLSIYKEEQKLGLDLPAVVIYCSDYIKTTERYDRFTNQFDIIINYFPSESTIMENNQRYNMLQEAERIAHAVNYINLPAYRKQGEQLVEYKLPNKRIKCEINEKDGFIQIVVRYTVRTKELKLETPKMKDLELNLGC